jgi:hypothetical protein
MKPRKYEKPALTNHGALSHVTSLSPTNSTTS